MTADEKLKALAAGIAAAELGSTKVIHCPYCNADLDFSEPSGGLVKDSGHGPEFMDSNGEIWRPPTCCADFGLAAIAILQRKEVFELKDIADRVHANVGGTAVFN